MNPTLTPHSHLQSGSSGATADDQTGISFWQLFLHRKWLITFCLCVGFGLGYLYFNRLPPVYSSSARVHVYIDETRLPLEEIRYHDRRLDLQNTHIQIIRSPMIIGSAVNEHGIGGIPSLQASDNKVGVILGNLHVEGIEDTDIISMSYTCRYPDD